MLPATVIPVNARLSGTPDGGSGDGLFPRERPTLRAQEVHMTETLFEQLYSQSARPPWDTDGPAPFVVELEREGWFRDEVLDAGCGTGENALFLASRGHTVAGFDVSPTAVANAADKARERGLTVSFAVADACDLAGATDRFTTVLDCGLFHSLDESQQARYVAALHRATRPGAVVHLRSARASDEARSRPRERPERTDVPPFFANVVRGWSEEARREFVRLLNRSVSRDDLQRSFADGWSMESLRTIDVEDGQPVQFWQARLRRIP
jgi:SAM-dependent methyltransferase